MTQRPLFEIEEEEREGHACGDPDCIVPHPPAHKKPPPTTEEIVRAQEVAPARASDPETAQQAADAWPEVRGEQRIRVFRYLLARGSEGATDFQIGEALKIQRTSAGKRRKELFDLGYVEETDRRGQTDTGSSAIVWQISPAVLLNPEKVKVHD